MKALPSIFFTALTLLKQYHHVMISILCISSRSKGQDGMTSKVYILNKGKKEKGRYRIKDKSRKVKECASSI